MSQYSSLYEHTFRFIFIGDCSVGKTSLANRLVDNRFIPYYDATIGVDYSSMIVELNNGTRAKCQLWDTAGQESFAPLVKSYYRNIAGAIIVFDVTCRRSFKRLKFWLQELRQNSENNYSIPKLLIGNKIDSSRRCISFEEANEFADRNDLIYRETSAKKSENVMEPFQELCNKVAENIEENMGVTSNRQVDLEKQDSDKDRTYYYNCYKCNIS